MTSEWLSESGSSGAKSVILLGPLSKDQLLEELEKFPLGILWFSPPVQQNITLPSNVKNISRSKNALLIKSALETFILLDYDTPPSVKVSNNIEEDKKIVEATINMCHNLGYSVVAEGVEDKATLDLLVDLSCDLIQGYFFTKPIPINLLPKFNEEFMTNFRFLLREADGINIDYEPIDYSEENMTYCGVHVSHNPYYNHI